MGIVTKLSSLFTMLSVSEVVFVLVLFITLFEIWILFVSNFIRPCNFDGLIRKQLVSVLGVGCGSFCVVGVGVMRVKFYTIFME
jgi:hypothetical protein